MTLAELLEQCGIDVDDWTDIPEQMGYELKNVNDDGQIYNVYTAKVVDNKIFIE